MYLGEKAHQVLTAILHGNDAGDLATPERLGPLVSESAIGLLRSGYMVNPWFQQQQVHTLSAFCLRNPQGEILSTAIIHLARRDGAPGYVLVSPSEHPVAEDYLDRRVVEETKVEMGIL